jgi:hypothetical protein
LSETRCHFCEKELPEPPSKHTIYAAGALHRGDAELPFYPVCLACLKFHRLQTRELRREEP